MIGTAIMYLRTYKRQRYYVLKTLYVLYVLCGLALVGIALLLLLVVPSLSVVYKPNGFRD